jgi:hypothetical protein
MTFQQFQHFQQFQQFWSFAEMSKGVLLNCQSVIDEKSLPEANGDCCSY